MSNKLRPKVVGLVHRDRGLPGLNEILERERRRVEAKISKLPKNSLVGVELTPDYLDGVRRGFMPKERDLIAYAALVALSNGHRLVSIENAARNRRAGTLLANSNPLKILATAGGKFAARSKGIKRRFVANSYLRSISMGEEILRQGCVLSFVGNSHVRHLGAAAEHFVLDPSSESVLDPFAGDIETNVFSQARNAGLKQSLEKLLQTRLSKVKKHKLFA